MSNENPTELTRLAELSTQLEDLPHSSNAYHALLKDHVLVKQTVVTCENMVLLTAELPRDMVEAHYFPSQFVLSDFKAELSEFPAESEMTADAATNGWSLSANYKINNNQYSLNANAVKTTLTTHNFDGTELSYSFKPEMAVRFLAGIALGALRNGESFNPESSDFMYASDAALIAHYLFLIGNSNGQYDAEQTSFIMMTEQSRSLMITRSESENKTGSAEAYNYRLILKIGETLLADTASQHHAVTQDDKVFITHFAERQPGYTEPEDLPFGDLLTTANDTGGVLFEPATDTIEYMRVNAAIMFFIGQCIGNVDRYRELDAQPSIEELVADEELTEKYFNELRELE